MIMKKRTKEDLDEEEAPRLNTRRFGNQAVTVSKEIASIDFSTRIDSTSGRKKLKLPTQVDEFLELGTPCQRPFDTSKKIIIRISIICTVRKYSYKIELIKIGRERASRARGVGDDIIADEAMIGDSSSDGVRT